jgi:hypothetical protein
MAKRDEGSDAFNFAMAAGLFADQGKAILAQSKKDKFLFILESYYLNDEYFRHLKELVPDISVYKKVGTEEELPRYIILSNDADGEGPSAIALEKELCKLDSDDYYLFIEKIQTTAKIYDRLTVHQATQRIDDALIFAFCGRYGVTALNLDCVPRTVDEELDNEMSPQLLFGIGGLEALITMSDLRLPYLGGAPDFAASEFKDLDSTVQDVLPNHVQYILMDI